MFQKLSQNDKAYFINSKRSFSPNLTLTPSDIQQSFNFAYDMTFGEKGEHRKHRSGGENVRKNGEIFINTFQGKLAEFAFYNYYKPTVPSLTAPDCECMKLNAWDGGDFHLDGHDIAIKSTKHYGHLLLLETKDWTKDGLYKPNLKTNNAQYDAFVLLRIAPDGDKLMKEKRWLYSDHLDKHPLQEWIANQDWKCDLAGFITRDEFVSLIQNDFVLPRQSLLNGKVRMDAENYYVQAGDTHRASELLEKLQEQEETYEVER